MNFVTTRPRAAPMSLGSRSGTQFRRLSCCNVAEVHISHFLASVSIVTWLALAMQSTLPQLFCATFKRNLARQTIILILLFSENLLIYGFRILAIVIAFQRRCIVERGGLKYILQIFGLNNLFLHKIKIYLQSKKVGWGGKFHKNLVMSKICNPKIKRGLLLKNIKCRQLKP